LDGILLKGHQRKKAKQEKKEERQKKIGNISKSTEKP